MGGRSVRVFSGYGPQENWRMEDKIPFFRALEEEVKKAQLNGKLIYIQMDANSKLGPDIIKGDPHKQSENRKILARIIRRNALIVMNSLEKKCKGKITRRRITNKVKEESIIDFVIVCDEMDDMISNVVIDEDKNHVLTRHTKTKNGVKIKESDHMSIITEVKIAWDKSRNTEKIEMYNFKDVEGLAKFKKMTSKITFCLKCLMTQTRI